MMQKDSPRMRAYFTVLVMLAELAHLAWEHLNGGIRSHHLLNRADLPAISNAWGALLLPALTWFLVARIQKRIALHPGRQGTTSGLPLGIIASFFAALFFGFGLSAAFTFDYSAISSNMFMAALVLATILPLYRAECVLGFILGLTFTFGGVLPIIIASVIATISAFFGYCVHPLLFWFAKLFKRKPAMGPTRISNSND